VLKFTEERFNLVWHVVNNLKATIPRCLEDKDLFQWGCMGLLVAYKTYNKEKGFEFSTWAYKEIKWYILNELRKLTHSRTVSEGNMYTEKSFEYTDEEDKMLARYYPNEGLDAFRAVEDRYDIEMLMKHIPKQYYKKGEHCGERTLYILERCFNDDISLVDIGFELGIIPSRISEIITDTLNLLKESAA